MGRDSLREEGREREGGREGEGKREGECRERDASPSRFNKVSNVNLAIPALLCRTLLQCV